MKGGGHSWRNGQGGSTHVPRGGGAHILKAARPVAPDYCQRGREAARARFKVEARQGVSHSLGGCRSHARSRAVHADARVAAHRVPGRGRVMAASRARSPQAPRPQPADRLTIEASARQP